MSLIQPKSTYESDAEHPYHLGTEGPTYPRVLIVVMGRINTADASNNGLLLRNLFAEWLRENTAQIFSSGENGDQGFFGRYYKLGSQECRLGKLFYRLKMKAQAGEGPDLRAMPSMPKPRPRPFKTLLNSLLVDSGLYEVLFKPRISAELLAWAQAFKPDLIFSQGYSLRFAWLPVMLAQRLSVPIAYYPTDDWPSEAYRANIRFPCLARFMSRVVTRSAGALVEQAALRLAFNPYMKQEYSKRYQRDFSVLMHGDDKDRFEAVRPRRLAEPDEHWIVTTGIFNENRKPLLDDLDQACTLLNERGLKVKATVFPVGVLSDRGRDGEPYRHLRFAPCPSHEELPALLRGADILFLPERFDKSAEGISLSISTKAHLFMFSGKPIVVYSAPSTGIARYAREEGWAALVDHRDPCLLAEAISRLIVDGDHRQSLIANAGSTADRNHGLGYIRSEFRNRLASVCIGQRASEKQ